MEERVLTAAVRSGILLRLRRGAYVRSAQWQAAEAWTRDDLQIQAHFESTGGFWPATAMSVPPGCTNATSGMRGRGSTSPRITQTPCEAPAPTSGPTARIWHLRSWQRSGARTAAEILTTSIERTVLDCARILPLEQAAVIGDHALAQGCPHRRYAPTAGRGARSNAGAAGPLDLLGVLDGRSESVGETRTRLLLRSFGLRTFVPQFEIPTPTGRFRADFADPGARVVIEFDGSGQVHRLQTHRRRAARRASPRECTDRGRLAGPPPRMEAPGFPRGSATAAACHDGPVPDSARADADYLKQKRPCPA